MNWFFHVLVINLYFFFNRDLIPTTCIIYVSLHVLQDARTSVLQTHHFYSTLKRRGNSCFHVVSTWNTSGMFVGRLQEFTIIITSLFFLLLSQCFMYFSLLMMYMLHLLRFVNFILWKLNFLLLILLIF